MKPWESISPPRPRRPSLHVSLRAVRRPHIPHHTLILMPATRNHNANLILTLRGGRLTMILLTLDPPTTSSHLAPQLLKGNQKERILQSMPARLTNDQRHHPLLIQLRRRVSPMATLLIHQDSRPLLQVHRRRPSSNHLSVNRHQHNTQAGDTMVSLLLLYHYRHHHHHPGTRHQRPLPMRHTGSRSSVI